MSKTILITGANRGLGLELAKQYLADNWQVIPTCRKLEEANKLKELGLTPLALEVDSEKSTAHLVNELKGQAIDILFNNAGIFGPRGLSLSELKQDDWLEVLKTNTVSPALLAGALVDNVAKSSHKLMVFMSSSMGSIANGSAGEYIYRSSKAGLNMVVARAAQELAPRGVRTVAMDPGWVRTDMGGESASLSPEESVRGMKNVLDNLSKSSTGVYLRYDGSKLEW